MEFNGYGAGYGDDDGDGYGSDGDSYGDGIGSGYALVYTPRSDGNGVGRSCRRTGVGHRASSE